ISMVRALMRSIFGRKAGRSFCSMMVHRTPRLPRSIASVRPVGPAPTIKTSLSIVFHSSADCRSFRLTRRRRGLKFLERLIGCAGTLVSRGVDKLGYLTGEIDCDLGRDLA